MKTRFVFVLVAMFIVTLLPSCAIPVPGGTITIDPTRILGTPLCVNRGPVNMGGPPLCVVPVPQREACYVPYGYQNARSYGTGQFRNNSRGPLGASWQQPWCPPMNNGPTYGRSFQMPTYIQVPQYHPHAPFQPQ